MNSKSLSRIAAATLLSLLAATHGARASELTAFQLFKEGDKYLGDQSKGKVVQARSEKSIAGLAPNVWYIVFYDPDTTFKAQEIKFGAGKKLSQSRPWRMIEVVTGDKVLPAEKLKIDSDEAIKIATKEPLLEKLKLQATQLWLDRGEENPTWKVRLWAKKLRDPSRDADIGDVHIDARTGKVLEVDLHINRVD
jgi:hypothetical protein